MQNGKGKINFIYSSIFKENQLMNIKAKIFEEIKKKSL